MATIIRRVNPNRKIGHGGVVFVCSCCGAKYNTFELGRACAIADFARVDAAVRNAARRARRAARKVAS